jgi:hypothetical protein
VVCVCVCVGGGGAECVELFCQKFHTGWHRTGDDDDYEHKDKMSYGNTFFYGLLTFLGKDTPGSPRSWSG